ncbi:MAG: UDP-glucose 4-epimerase GalE [Actinomycetota bacterium]
MTRWLVTGGAGYIGAHVVKSLLENNFEVVVVDDLSTGLERKIPKNVKLFKLNIANTLELSSILNSEKIEGVIHLAAKKAVGESVINPSLYYQENIGGLISLLEAMSNANVKKIVYSSSAAVYGTPKVDRVSEKSETNPESPYGETKLVGEWLLKADEKARNVRWISLRYFNVVGAGSDELGDTGVNNLIPMVFSAISKNERPQIFGNDYPTKDGTCIRDYIHVEDLAFAHVLAAKKLTEEYSEILNIGTGLGYSVKEVMDLIEKVVGKKINYEYVSRRPGDPAQTIADPSKALKDLSWKAKLDLEEMISTSWKAWQKHNPINEK